MNQREIDADPDVQAQGLRVCRQLLGAGDCRSIRYFGQIDSTNSAACRDLSAGGTRGDDLPRLYLSDVQTAGRGRLGRDWLADQGTLTFSLLCAIGDDPASTIRGSATSLVALATGVAVARTIEYLAAPVSARIKWPNDVHVGGGKVAGVLVESVAHHGDRLVIGVGLNVATALDRFADQIATPARSLNQVACGPAHRYDWLPELLAQMCQAYKQLGVQPDRLLDELRGRCLLTGSPVRYQCGETTRHGRCLGIDQQGALLVQHEGHVHALRSGEVWQVRPSSAH